MILVFERFFEVLNTWFQTGELPRDEFRVRGIGRRGSDVIVAVGLLAFALWLGLCVYIAIGQP